jgi:hypothetical protein
LAAGYERRRQILDLAVLGRRARCELIRNPKTKRARGKLREMGLGSCTTVGLEDARRLAREYRRLLRTQGVDPIEARRGAQEQRAIEKAKAMSFRDAAEAYIKSTAMDGGTRNTPRSGR